MVYNKDGSFNDDQLIIEAKATLDRIITYINYCDQKTGIILGALGVVFSIILSLDGFSRLKTIIDSLKNANSLFLLITIYISIFLMVSGVVLLILTLIPVINSTIFKEKYLNTNSKIYFGTIANKISYEDYKRKFSNFRKQDYLNDLISQIYINSKIASNKYHLYRYGIFTSLIGLIVFVVAVITSVSFVL